MEITLSGGDHGGLVVIWIDDSTGHMLIKDHLYRLHKETASAQYVSKAQPESKTKTESPKKASWFK